SSKSPKITKVEPNAYLEWTVATTSMKSTHYFQIADSQEGKATVFTQGERCDGWGASFQSSDNGRRGLIAMNNSLQLEVMRRREKSGDKNESSEKEADHGDDVVAQLDISDQAAVAVAAAAGAFASIPAAAETTDTENTGMDISGATNFDEKAEDVTASTEVTQASESSVAGEKPVEKRSSIIGAVSSLFSSSRLSCSDRIQTSSSKEDLISPVPEEQEAKDGSSSDAENDEEGEEEEEEADLEDPIAKQLREAKNAERIVLDLGTGDMSLGDFGL
ncbi:hypothetical protein BGZ76_010994, partial [Entomortierella beljakovae]